jgi:cobalt-zinc-cadmium efflux system protein
MHHHHGSGDSVKIKNLFITMLLNFLITVFELIGGLLYGSLALISDALHNFSDGTSLIISYIAIRLSYHPSSPRHTFGLKRANILAAILNATTLIVISVFLFREAIHRFIHPEAVSGRIMIVVSIIALLANIAGTYLLREDARRNINIKSSYLHLLSDAVSSFGVIVGGIGIWLYQWYWIDPLLTIMIAVYVLFESWKIVKESIHIIMMGAPADIDILEIEKDIENIPNVKDLHHVHIWMLDDNQIHFEGHVKLDDMPISKAETVLERIQHVLKEKHGIQHITIQFECHQCDSVNSLLHKP